MEKPYKIIICVVTGCLEYRDTKEDGKQLESANYSLYVNIRDVDMVVNKEGNDFERMWEALTKKMKNGCVANWMQNLGFSK